MDEQMKWYDERVEAYVDGELPEDQARRFEARLAGDRELRSAVHRARELQRALRSVPGEACPPAVKRAVLEATGTRAFDWRWAWAAAPALAAALVLAMNLPVLVGPAQPRAPSAEELAQARLELGIALAYLDRAGEAAGRGVGSHLVGDGLAKPLNRSLHHAQESRAKEDAS